VGTATATIDATIATALPPIIGELAGDIRNLPFEVRALVASLQQPSAAARNRRKSARHPFLYEVVVRTRHPRTGAQRNLTCHTRDRNDGHVAFLTAAMLPVGSEVVLDFTTQPETQPLGRIHARVRRCRQFVSGWFECVAFVGADVRTGPTSSWERFTHWVGEFTGFGPDRRSEFQRSVTVKRKTG
jgi:hypothetical protein